jgi:hypothetical protein
MAAMSATWPRAELDQVRRLRVIAGAVGGGVYREVHLAMPPEQVWRVVADLEHELPYLVRTEDGVRRAIARGSWRKRADFSVVLRPGWCLMQSRFLVGGMAAVAEDGGTRLAFYGAFRIRGLRWLRPLLRVTHARLADDFTRRLRQRLAARIS